MEQIAMAGVWSMFASVMPSKAHATPLATARVELAQAAANLRKVSIGAARLGGGVSGVIAQAQRGFIDATFDDARVPTLS